jgi:hypothetical protein
MFGPVPSCLFRTTWHPRNTMKNSLCALCLCGFWLVICGCSAGVRGRQLQPLTITSPVLPQAALNEAYGGGRGFSVTAAGGVAPYIWTWTAADRSNLPPGMKLRSNPDGTGTIFGAPTDSGPYGVMVSVTDSESPPVRTTATYVITVTTSRPRQIPGPNGAAAGRSDLAARAAVLGCRTNQLCGTSVVDAKSTFHSLTMVATGSEGQGV